MKTTTKTIKGWANNSMLTFSENTTNDTFLNSLDKFIQENLKGFKRLGLGETLRGKNATEKVIIKGWYWHGSWSDPTKETFAVFYKS